MQSTVWQPAIPVCLIGLLYHRSLPWFGCFVFTLVFDLAIDASTRITTSLRQVKAAISDFFNDASAFHLTEVESSRLAEFLEVKDYPQYAILSRFSMLKRLPEDEVRNTIPAEPVRLFIARKKGGGLLGGARAYSNSFGRSYVFVSVNPDRMNTHQLFILLHELEHTSSRQGANHLAYVSACRIGVWVGIVLLPFMIQTWLQGVFTVVYLFHAFIMAFSYYPHGGEVIADHGAIRELADRISHEELKIFLQDLSELLQDQLSNEKSRSKKLQCIERLRHLTTLRRDLEEGHLMAFYNDQARWRMEAPVFFAIPFSALLAYLAVRNPSPPILPFTLMGVYCAWSVIALAQRSVKLVNLNTYIARRLSTQSSLDLSHRG